MSFFSVDFKRNPNEDRLYNNHINSTGDDIVVKKFSTYVRQSDLRTLAPKTWLNDIVIEYYINLLVAEFSSPSKRIFYLNSFFYERLTKPYQKPGDGVIVVEDVEDDEESKSKSTVEDDEGSKSKSKSTVEDDEESKSKSKSTSDKSTTLLSTTGWSSRAMRNFKRNSQGDNLGPTPDGSTPNPKVAGKKSTPNSVCNYIMAVSMSLCQCKHVSIVQHYVSMSV